MIQVQNLHFGLRSRDATPKSTRSRSKSNLRVNKENTSPNDTQFSTGLPHRQQVGILLNNSQGSAGMNNSSYYNSQNMTTSNSFYPTTHNNATRKVDFTQNSTHAYLNCYSGGQALNTTHTTANDDQRDHMHSQQPPQTALNRLTASVPFAFNTKEEGSLR